MTTIAVGDVVQIDPEHDDRFGGCFLIVTEVRSWGAIGYVRVPGEDAGDAFYRVPWEHCHQIGRAEWVRADDLAK